MTGQEKQRALENLVDKRSAMNATNLRSMDDLFRQLNTSKGTGKMLSCYVLTKQCTLYVPTLGFKNSKTTNQDQS